MDCPAKSQPVQLFTDWLCFMVFTAHRYTISPNCCVSHQTSRSQCCQNEKEIWNHFTIPNASWNTQVVAHQVSNESTLLCGLVLDGQSVIFTVRHVLSCTFLKWENVQFKLKLQDECLITLVAKYIRYKDVLLFQKCQPCCKLDVKKPNADVSCANLLIIDGTKYDYHHIYCLKRQFVT